jgi:hypothetical protein
MTHHNLIWALYCSHPNIILALCLFEEGDIIQLQVIVGDEFRPACTTWCATPSYISPAEAQEYVFYL